MCDERAFADHDEFLRQGLQLSVDGLEPQAIQAILETEVEHIQERHRLGAEIFTTMGTFAPALGMIGTLIGLVQMLQSMDDPSRIGPAMAVALITIFYGAILANMVFLPIAGKLRTQYLEYAWREIAPSMAPGGYGWTKIKTGLMNTFTDEKVLDWADRPIELQTALLSSLVVSSYHRRTRRSSRNFRSPR